MSLFEKLLDMGLRNEQQKSGKNRIVDILFGNVTKAIKGKETGESTDTEVR